MKLKRNIVHCVLFNKSGSQQVVNGFPAALAVLSVWLVRSDESVQGIRVFDSNGNSVGLSRAAADEVRVQTFAFNPPTRV